MLREKTIVQASVAFVLLMMASPTIFGDSTVLTDAEQVLYATIGYQYPLGTNNIVEEFFVPSPPQGLGDADLETSSSHYGVSVSASLKSTFSENIITVNGYSAASAFWGEQPRFSGEHPDDANDVHGGVGPKFSLSLAKSLLLHISGTLHVNIDGYPSKNPEETYGVVQLSSGGQERWTIRLDGTNALDSRTFEYDTTLEIGQHYELQAIAASGVGADDDHDEFHSRSASFSLVISVSHEVLPLPDLVGEFDRISYKNPLAPGDTVKTQLIVDNINGLADVQPKQVIDIQFSLRPCGAIGGAEDIPVMLLTDQNVGKLKPGASRKINTRITIPVGLEGGEYRLVADVDSSNKVNEMIEINNRALSEPFEIVSQ